VTGSADLTLKLIHQGAILERGAKSDIYDCLAVSAVFSFRGLPSQFPVLCGGLCWLPTASERWSDSSPNRAGLTQTITLHLQSPEGATESR